MYTHFISVYFSPPTAAQTSDFHINMSSIANFSSASSLSQQLTSVEWRGPPLQELRWDKGAAHYHTVCLHQCTASIMGLVIETNHSLSVAVAQAPQIQISFCLSGKLEQGELTCDPIPILLQQFGEAQRGYFIFRWGAQTICLRCITLQPEEWQNWPQHRATKTSLIGLFNFTVTQPVVRRWLCDSLHFVSKSTVTWNVKALKGTQSR